MSKEKIHKKKRRHIVIKTIATVLIVGFFYFMITFFQVYYNARTDQVNESTRADAIVVLGAAQYNGQPSPVLIARLQHALNLYNKNVAPVIIVTGGNQPGDSTTEASTSANWLIHQGVDDSKILREVRGRSTFDSIRDLSVILEEYGINKVVLITDGFHQKRSKLIAKEFNILTIGSPVKDSPISGVAEWKEFVTETVRICLGRIIGFRRVSRDSTIINYIKQK